MPSGDASISEWDLYAAHREQLTALLVRAAPPTGTGRLCILGAGKCHDLDLERLGQVYGELHLVDIDASAVAGAVARQPVALRSRLFPQAPVDLSVLSAKRRSKWQRRAPAAADLAAAGDATLKDTLRRLRGPFDVVLSACIITQLGFALSRAFGESGPLIGPLRLCEARTHLQTLLALTAPGGTSLWVSDLASSTHYPLDTLPPEADLTQVQRDVVSRRAFYHLAQPELISMLLGELAPEAALNQLAPWLWTGPKDRTYLVYGFLVRQG